MLFIAILIGVGAGFYGYANSNNIKLPWLWAILGPVSYYIFQIVAGFIIGMVAPDLLYDMGSILIVGLISGFAGVLITFFIMYLVGNKQKKNLQENTADILDTNTLD